jgi:hypothetical protein
MFPAGQPQGHTATVHTKEIRGPYLSSVRAPHKDTTVIVNSNKHLVMRTRRGSTSRHIDWLSVVTWLWLWKICGPGPPGCGSLKWDSKLWPWVLQDFDPGVTALARPRSRTSKVQTNLLIREGAPYQDTRNRHRDKRNLVMGSRWDPDMKTDWPDCQS